LALRSARGDHGLENRDHHSGPGLRFRSRRADPGLPDKRAAREMWGPFPEVMTGSILVAYIVEAGSLAVYGEKPVFCRGEFLLQRHVGNGK